MGLKKPEFYLQTSCLGLCRPAEVLTTRSNKVSGLKLWEMWKIFFFFFTGLSFRSSHVCWVEWVRSFDSVVIAAGLCTGPAGKGRAQVSWLLTSARLNHRQQQLVLSVPGGLQRVSLGWLDTTVPNLSIPQMRTDWHRTTDCQSRRGSRSAGPEGHTYWPRAHYIE